MAKIEMKITIKKHRHYYQKTAYYYSKIRRIISTFTSLSTEFKYGYNND